MTPIDLKAEMKKDGVTGNPAAYLAMKRQELRHYQQDMPPLGRLNDYYNESFACPNCHHAKRNIVYIRKGVPKSDVGPLTCANCGCECKL